MFSQSPQFYATNQPRSRLIDARPASRKESRHSADYNLSANVLAGLDRQDCVCAAGLSTRGEIRDGEVEALVFAQVSVKAGQSFNRANVAHCDGESGIG